MLAPFAPDLWLADGPPITAALGFHYPTRMAVIRLAGGDLVLWSPVAFDPALHAQIAALGRIAHLVAPNALHHMAMADWASPGAVIHPAPGLRAKRPDLTLAADLGDTPPPAWAGQIDTILIPNRIAPEVWLHHRASGTLLVTDLLQQMPRGWYRGWRALIAHLDGMTGPEPAVPQKFRLALDRPAARAALTRLRADPPRHVVMAHGTPVRDGGAAFLSRAFGWLGG